MSNDGELKPPEGWISEGVNSSTEIRDPSNSTGPDAENSEWVHESKNPERNPASDALTGAAIGVGSKVVNPITTKVLGKVADVIAGPHPANLKPSIYRPQPGSNAVTNWVKSQHIVSDYSPAANAKHYGEAHQKMMESYEAKKKAEALQKAENLFKTEEQIRKAATPVADTVRTVSNVMTPTGESMLGKAASLGAHTVGRAIAGGSAAYQGVDAYNRLQRGDYPGAVIGGIGALGSGVAMIPTPVTRVVGTGLGIGGELGTTLLDKYRESQKPEMAQGGPVQHFQVGGKALSSGLEALQTLIKAEGRTPIVPMPNRWFTKPEDFPHLQGMVGKVLDKNQMSRDAFHSGAFVDPRTGQILDKNIYNNVGVLIDPFTGKPMMSAGDLSGIESLKDLGNKAGNQTLSNLVRQGLFKHTGGDQMLSNTPFIATVEQGGMGHKYGLGTEYANPTQMYNTMRGENPTLRPKSRGDVFGMGDVVGQVQVGGPKGLTHDVYEKLFVAPKGSDVPGVKLSKATGGLVFDPQGSDYDYQTALAHGMGPNGAGENQGHWGSVAPVSDDEQQLHDLPSNSYVVLKGRAHPTFHKAEAAENERGSNIVQHGNRYYSVPGLAEGGQPPKPDANEAGAFVGYPQINKNRKIGSGTGFLDALVGAPPSRENILNPSDYSYMQGYEKGEPYGIAAMAAPFAGAAIKPLAKEIGTRAFMGEALTPKMMRNFMPEAPAAGIIKNEKGGNWMPEAMMDYNGWTPEQQLAETLGFHKNNPALENWVNTQLTRYVKNEMGTPGDPIRALADKGVLHYKPRPSRNAAGQNNNVYYHAEDKREMAGMPEGESALTQLGRDWENNVDLSVNTNTIDDKMIQEYGHKVPWLEKAKGQKLNSIDKEFMYSDLGFDHIADVLREQIAAGTLRPESLKSLSVPQAVQRTHEYNLAKEKAMQKIKLQADSEMPVAKDYPEQGYKWLELKHPTDSKVTEQSLKYEGDAMGHCVGGYCPDVLAGDTKIYSLRDAKGEPHVTIEVKNKAEPWMNQTHWDSDNNFHWKANVPISPEMKAEIDAEMVKKFGNREANLKNTQSESRWDFLESELRKRLGEPQPVLSVKQIKGKQNAKPKDEYQPFITDFLKSGKWSQVDDIHNTQLIPDQISQVQREKFNKLGIEVPKLMTEDEYRELMNKIGY